MYLKSIKLAGFKSFVDPTTFILKSNLTAVVGPNGCGKSNIIDAVRWVVGESSAKQLRGELLTDVIFNGSIGRKPVGQASIELLFDNSDGRLGGEYAQYAEISIRRQLTRDGQSQFFLNGARCRRRDIMDVFLGTGLGPRSYAIIEQGMISQMIEAKPEDIRIYLEEAAGISKYKERRRETENRIQHTRENLDRLNDLRQEVDKQLVHLKRQASAAERYKELMQEQRTSKAQAHALQWRQLTEELNTQQQHLQAQETQLDAKVAHYRHIDTEIEKNRAQQVEYNDIFNEVQGRYYQIGAEIARYESQTQSMQQQLKQFESDLLQINQSVEESSQNLDEDQSKIEELNSDVYTLEPELEQAKLSAEQSSQLLQNAERQMSDWQGQWDQFNTKAAKASQAIEVAQTHIQNLNQRQLGTNQRIQRLQEQLTQLNANDLPEKILALEAESSLLKEQIETLQSTQAECQEAISQQRGHITTAQRERDLCRDQLQQQLSRQASLETLQQAALGKTDQTTNQWLKQQQLMSHPRLAEGLEVESGWENAVETVLNPYLEAVCVDNFTSLSEALTQFSQGKIALFHTEDTATCLKSASYPALADKIKTKWPLQSLLSTVYIADDLSQALTMSASLSANESVITRDGIWLGASWIRIAKEKDEKSGVLQRKQELDALSCALDVQKEILSEKDEQLRHHQQLLVDSERKRDQLQHQFRDISTKFSHTHAEFSSKKTHFEQVTLQERTALQELSEHKLQLESLQQQQTDLQEKWQQAKTEQQSFEQQRAQLLQTRDQHRDELNRIRLKAQNDKQQVDDNQVRLSSTRNQLHYLTQNIQRTEKQLSQLHLRQETLAQNILETKQPLPELKIQLEQLLQKRLEVEKQLNDARAQLQAVEHQLHELEKQRSHSENTVGELRNQLEQLRMDIRTKEVHRDHHLEQITAADYQLETLLEEMPADMGYELLQQQIEKIQTRIQRLGAINLAAIDEHQQLSERKNYLDSQHNDLVEALTTLENAIHKIDRESRTRLRETFDKANDCFKALFPKIFGGGTAYMELTDDDVLNTGVIIKAQPPGKRNSTIHLLSGGEKALTATALIFSFFQLNPAPFCMLDEVDAPLDDANVGRFCNLVKEMSEKVQFIFITHNKGTMALAHQLTGVTMSEPGVSRLVAVDIEEAMAWAEKDETPHADKKQEVQETV